MAIIFKMPALSPTMTEGVLISWYKKEGEDVAKSDLIIEIETDKATMDVESIYNGKLVKILVPGGTNDVAVGTPIGIIREANDTDDAVQKAINEHSETGTEPTKIATHAKAADTSATKPAVTPSTEATRRISPLARRLAEVHGVDIAKIQQGTGPGGRIVKNDVMKFAANPISSACARIQGEYLDEPLSPMQQVIGERLLASKQQAPHFYMSASIDATQLLERRIEANNSGKFSVRLTVTDFIIKAAALAMQDVPQVNVVWSDGKMRRFSASDISIAIATPDGGLYSPVIHAADAKSVTEISTELKELVRLAQEKRLTRQHMDGGALSISNLGMFKIDGFFPIINPSQGMILSVGSARKTPVYDERGGIVPANIVQFGLAIDHRMINGSDAARFLERLAVHVASVEA